MVPSNVPPDTGSCARICLGAACVVDLDLGFAAHHDRNFPDRQGQVLLACNGQAQQPTSLARRTTRTQQLALV